MLLAMSFLSQGIVAAAQGPVAGRVVTRDEGEAIVDAISERRPLQGGRKAKPDCSHLVNDVYNVAGFPYVYAKSSDLYGGHPSFVRVKSPQPGDLIVWRGHVGLVTDPREHLFYSSLRSGLDVEDYTSAYWTKHGTPRFYRYRFTNDQAYLLARETTSERSERESNTGFRTLQVKQSTRHEQSEASLGGESADKVLGPSNNSVIAENSTSPTMGVKHPGRNFGNCRPRQTHYPTGKRSHFQAESITFRRHRSGIIVAITINNRDFYRAAG